MSMTYYPQTDGQTEVMNRTVEQYLRSFIHHKPAEWYKFVALVEWSYNTSQQSGTGFTPYEVIYSKPPLSVPDYLKGSSCNDAVDTMLFTRETIHATQIPRQLRMKLHAFISELSMTVSYRPLVCCNSIVSSYAL